MNTPSTTTPFTPSAAEPGNNPPVFDRSGEFEIPVKLAKKSVIVRFPTDDQLCRRQVGIKVFFKRRAGGTVTEVEGDERADAELLSQIKISGDDLDEAEAGTAIGLLLRADPSEGQMEGDSVRLNIRVAGCVDTIHVLRVPTVKELRKHERGAMVTIDGRHGSELKSNPSAFGDFYDKLLVESTGYVGTVPLSHKMVAVRELLAVVKKIETESDPENFT